MNHDLKVFVYGTLKPGGHYWPEFCEGKLAVDPQAAKIRGELYDLHVGYPGLLLNGDLWIQGYVLTFRNEADFWRLDYLEGFEPDRPEDENEYNRLKVPCYTPDGESLGDVWAYEMTRATAARHRGTRIENGNWPINVRK